MDESGASNLGSLQVQTRHALQVGNMNQLVICQAAATQMELDFPTVLYNTNGAADLPDFGDRLLVIGRQKASRQKQEGKQQATGAIHCCDDLKRGAGAGRHKSGRVGLADPPVPCDD